MNRLFLWGDRVSKVFTRFFLRFRLHELVLGCRALFRGYTRGGLSFFGMTRGDNVLLRHELLVKFAILQLGNVAEL